MSDETGDAEFEASLANLTGGGEGGDAPDPDAESGLAGRLDAIHGTLSTLGMRVDALVTSTTSYRSALTDRLAEYAELVTKTARNQAADLEEYRRTTERTIAEVRGSMAAAEEALRSLADRVDGDGVVTTGGDGGGEGDRRVVAEVRSVLDAQDRLSSFLTEALDRFADRVLARVDESEQATAAAVQAVRQDLDRAATRDPAAGLREDLAQIRAITSTVAERDHTASLAAIRSSVDQVADRVTALADGDDGEAVAVALGRVEAGVDALGAVDVPARVAESVRTELTALQAAVDELRAADPAATVVAELAPVQSALDGLVGRLDGLATGDDVRAASDDLRSQVLDALGRIEDRVAGTAESAQVRGIAADLRAHLADAIAGFDGPGIAADVAEVRAALAGVREAADGSRADVAGAVDQLRETLLDVASGEVVGALWDELRELRTGVDALAAAAGDDGTAPTLAAVDGLRADVAALGERLEASPTGDAVAAVAGDLAALRAEVAELAAAAPTAGPDLDALAEAVAEATGAATSQDVADLRAALDAAVGRAPEPDPAAAALTGRVGELLDEVRALLDAAEIDDGDPEPADGLGEVGSDRLDEVADTLATLRRELQEGLVVEPAEDLVATIEALRAELGAVRDGLAGVAELRDAVAGVQARLDEGLVLADDGEPDEVAAPAEVVATIDPDTIDLLRAEIRAAAGDVPAGGGIDAEDLADLRDEIRAAGGVSDQVVDALREELKALRRRIAVKAQEKVLDDAQLAQIADAVAERLGRD